MHFYSPSPLSLGYIPRGSYRPALVPTYLDDESSSLTFEGLGYPAYAHTFPPRLEAETRYRRAVHELQAAEEEFEAHLTLRRARQAVILRERTARRDRALAIQAEVERIERARALQVKLAEEYELHQRAHRAQATLDRVHRQNAFLHGFVNTSPRGPCASERPCAFAKKRLTYPEPAHRHVLRDNKVVAFNGLLKLFSGIHLQPQSLLQQSSSPAPPLPRSTERQPSKKQDSAADAVNAILEFLHGLATHTKDAANESENISKVRLFSGVLTFGSNIRFTAKFRSSVSCRTSR